MSNYRHTQKGQLILWALWTAAAIQLVIAFAVNQLVVWQIIGAVTVLLLLIGWLFSSLTVSVSESELKWHFGPGFWRKSIARADIKSAEPVKTKWWYGWGIRYTPRGWLYNVSGFDAVAVTEHSGRTTLIGTDKPDALVAVLTKQ